VLCVDRSFWSLSAWWVSALPHLTTNRVIMITTTNMITIMQPDGFIQEHTFKLMITPTPIPTPTHILTDNIWTIPL
jgi:hypothetical protein